MTGAKKPAPITTDLKVGECLRLDSGRIIVTLERKSGQIARLRIEADESVRIDKVKLA